LGLLNVVLVPLLPDNVSKGMFLVCLFVPSSGQILLPQYLMNALNNLDETTSKYSLASTDDLIRFWRSQVKVMAWHSRWCWGVEVTPCTCTGGATECLYDNWVSCYTSIAKRLLALCL